MTTSTNPVISETKSAAQLRSPDAVLRDRLAARLRAAGCADCLPPSGPVTTDILADAVREYEHRLSTSHPHGIGERPLSARAREVAEALQRGDASRADELFDVLDRERARVEYMRAERERRERELAEARTLPAPAAWAELAAERGVHAPAVVDHAELAAELATERELSAMLLSMFDARLVERRGEVIDELRRLRHALVGHGLPAVATRSVFAADADTLMPPREPFVAPLPASNDMPPAWRTKLASDVGKPMPRKPGPPRMAPRIGDPEVDAAAEREVREQHVAELEAWKRGTAEAHGQVVGGIDAALDALAAVEPGSWRAWWLYQVRHHVAGEHDKVRVSLDDALRALTMDSVWSALVEPVSLTSKPEVIITKASKQRTRG